MCQASAALEPCEAALLEQSPGNVAWSSRFGTLVHDNVDQADLAVTAGGQQIASNRSLWMKLSDDVLLVPVVVISWRTPGRTFVDHARLARAAFDFIPYDKPLHMGPLHTLAQLDNPNVGYSIMGRARARALDPQPGAPRSRRPRLPRGRPHLAGAAPPLSPAFVRRSSGFVRPDGHPDGHPDECAGRIASLPAPASWSRPVSATVSVICPHGAGARRARRSLARRLK